MNEYESSSLPARLDEISLLREYFQKSVKKIRDYEQEKHTNHSILNNYFLKKLVQDSISLTDIEIKSADVHILNTSKCYALCLVKIDHYVQFCEKYSNKDRSLFRFVIMNTFSELLSNHFVNQAVDLETDEIVLILNLEELTVEFTNKVCKIAHEIQAFLMNRFEVSFSVFISTPHSNWRQLTNLYNRMVEHSVYRFILGQKCIVTEEMLQKNIQNVIFNYPMDLEKKLVTEVKAGDSQSAEHTLAQIFDCFAVMSYLNVVLAYTYLLNSLRNTMDEIEQYRLKSVGLNFNQLTRNINELETLDEVHKIFIKIIHSLSEKDKTPAEDKHVILVETIKNLIDVNYSNSELGVQYIASLLKMSSTHVGRLFKHTTGLSITNYINEIRLCKALELLVNTNLSVAELVPKIGIENESYFYKLFKKKFGTTPKEYVLNHTLQGMNSTGL